MKAIFKFTLLGITTVALSSSNLVAAEKVDGAESKKSGAPVSKAERAGLLVTFHGSLAAKTDASITIGETVIEVTSETKITKDGKPATMADGEIGKAVSGQYRRTGGKFIARSVRFSSTEKATPSKPKKEKPAAIPEAKSETKPEVKAEPAPAPTK